MRLTTRTSGAKATAAKKAASSFAVTMMLISLATHDGMLASAYSVRPTPPTENVVGGSGSGSGSRRTFLTRTVGGAAAATAATAVSLVVAPSMPAGVVGVGVANAASSPSTLPSVGTKAPEFELPNSRGEGKTSLTDLVRDGRGKWTVLYFYPGAFTSGCTLEARGFQRDMDKYRKLGAQIVGVSVDSVEKNAQFCSSEGLDFYMLSDQGGQVSKLYGSALSIPGFGTFSNRQTYLIDPRGNLRWVFTDVESRVPRHSAEVLDKLEELQKDATTV